MKVAIVAESLESPMRPILVTAFVRNSEGFPTACAEGLYVGVSEVQW